MDKYEWAFLIAGMVLAITIVAMTIASSSPSSADEQVIRISFCYQYITCQDV